MAKSEMHDNIVGIGASAGGLEALEQFFSNMPPKSGLSFVVIQHLSPDYKSLMAELLSKYTSMPVLEAQDGMEIDSNCVYLIPRRKNMTVFHRKLYLTERGQDSGLHLPIDIFLHSLADDQGEKAIAIILSGTGSDGTRGIRAIKEAGGMVMAQDEYSAKFDGMPRSAISTKLVDYILPPDQMPTELMNYVQHPCLATDPAVKPAIMNDEDTLSKIFATIRSRHGLDFSFYKRSTMVRRIERRMSINQLEKLNDYLQYLYRSQSELHTLYKELLIGVTKFFRDPEAYDFIEKTAIPTIFEDKRPRDQIRIWVAGCSTGEEAYSLAILFREHMNAIDREYNIKVFATDIDKDALEYAGRGIYPESIVADVSRERLRHFFIKRGDSYEIARQIREMVIFAQQNLIKDPPFSKIDLISCRNVMIYLQTVLQKRVLSIFQFALRPNGFLFLGTSETVGSDLDFFNPQHNRLKIYQYKGGYRPLLNDDTSFDIPVTDLAVTNRRTTQPQDNHRSLEHFYRYLIEEMMPPCIVVNDNYELMHAFGAVDQYLKVPSGGQVSLNILRMVRQDLSIALSTAIHKVMKDNTPVVYRNVVINNDEHIDLIAKPIQGQYQRQKRVLIEFSPSREQHLSETPDGTSEAFDIEQSANQRITDLEQELQYTRENLQATIEELETSNEELQATNEELLAANEELQSTNEELQSVNEELITVNAEYQAKIRELTDLNNDMSNLLSSTNIGTIFLDKYLQVRKFTPAAQREINLIAQDIGRPLSHISHTIKDCNLAEQAQEVLKTLISSELEAQNAEGQWYLIKFMPYRTLENTIGGVVITLIDITDLKKADENLLKLSTAVDQSSNLVAITTLSGEIEYVNQVITQRTGYSSVELHGTSWWELVSEESHVVDPAELWQAISTSKEWHGELRYNSRNGHDFWVRVAILPIRDSAGELRNFLTIAQDLTDQKEAEAALEASEQRFQSLSETAFDGIVILEDCCITEVNQSFAEMFGYPRDELIGRPLTDIVAPAFQDIVQSYINEQVEIVYEVKGRRKNGSTFPLEVHGKTINHEGRSVRVKAVRNLTDRRHQQFYEAVVHNLPRTIVYIFDRNFRYTTVEGQVDSPELAALEGKTVRDAWPTEVSEVLTPAYEAVFHGEVSYLTIQVNGRTYATHTLPMHNEKGKVAAGMTFALDITSPEAGA